MYTWHCLAIGFYLSGPVVYGFKSGGVIDIEYDHNGIAILVVEGEQGPELFLTCSVPQVHPHRLSPTVL